MPKFPGLPVRQTVAPTRCRPFIRCAALLMVSFWIGSGDSAAADEASVRPGSNLQSFLNAEAELRREIEIEVGAAACTKDAQCRVLGLGTLACGGPEAWLAWSPSSSRPGVVQRKAARLEAMARERNRRFGLASQCVVLPVPRAVCHQGRCVLHRAHGLD